VDRPRWKVVPHGLPFCPAMIGYRNLACSGNVAMNLRNDEVRAALMGALSTRLLKKELAVYGTK
jgi:hypothetical protein